MTAALLYLKCQAIKTLEKPARIKLITILLLLLAAVGWGTYLRFAPSVISYNGARVPVISPIETQLCPGDTLHYPVVVEIKESEIPDQANIAESWCKEGLSGACTGVVPPRSNLPLLEPKLIVSDGAPRVVPETLEPGVYHFWHSATNSRGQVSGYIVSPIVVRDCSKENPQP